MKDFDRVDSKLYVGSYPEHSCRGFDVLVLCARELQRLPSECEPGVVIRVPIDDGVLASNDVSRVLRAANEINKLRHQGKRVLVTCAAGVNRSALVAALAMIKSGMYSPIEAVTTIRALRKPAIGMKPLGNPHFVDLLSRMR